MHLYLNNSSIKNNKYFKTHKELLALSNKELKEIKEYKLKSGFLKNLNKKLGKLIYSFDLPAVVSCPNSNECFKNCYANKGAFLYGGKGAKTSNTYNFAIALNDLKYLQKELIKEIEKKKIKTIRIHSSGDFFSKEYFVMWCNIAKRFNNIKIYMPLIYQPLLAVLIVVNVLKIVTLIKARIYGNQQKIVILLILQLH